MTTQTADDLPDFQYNFLTNRALIGSQAVRLEDHPVQTINQFGDLFVTMTVRVSSITAEAHPGYPCHPTHTTHAHS